MGVVVIWDEMGTGSLEEDSKLEDEVGSEGGTKTVTVGVNVGAMTVFEGGCRISVTVNVIGPGILESSSPNESGFCGRRFIWRARIAEERRWTLICATWI